MSDQKASYKSVFVVVLQMLIGGAVGFGIIEMVVQIIRAAGLPVKSYLLQGLATIPIAFLAAIVVHECGHLVGALSQGFRFHVLTIGPLAIIRMPRGFQLQWNFRVLMLIGGQQISSPPREVLAGESDKSYLVYLAGGGVANLVTAFASIAAMLWLSPSLWLNLFLAPFAAISIFFGVLNLLPLKFGAGIKTDGFHMRALLRGDEGATYFRTTFHYVYNAYEGVHPKLWPPTLIDAFLASANHPLEKAYAHAVEMSFAAVHEDHARVHAAALAMESHYDAVPRVFRASIAAALAHHYAVMQPDPEKVRRYAKDAQLRAYLGSPATAVRAAACAAIVDGRYQDAIQLCEQSIPLDAKGASALERMLGPEASAELAAYAREKLQKQNTSIGEDFEAKMA